MNAKRLSLALAALLAAGGLWWWFARSTSSTPSSQEPAMDVKADFKTPQGSPESGQMPNHPGRLAPPDPTRRFKDFTPEQRVEFARKGHGPGG